MTKSLGPFDYGTEPRGSASMDGKRRRNFIGLAFDLFFPLLIVAVAFFVGRNYVGF